jgi:glutamate-1-semialdehyde 2,1-aminomutase
MASQEMKPEDALEAATERFTKENPLSREIFESASQHLPAGNTRTTLFAPPFPPAITSASGCELRSADGKRLLDMVGDYTAGIYGHSHPRIIEALQQSLTKGFNFGATSNLEGELAKLIKERFEESAGLELVRFTNSGTEANLMAVGTARAWTGRSKIMVFTGAYHGSVLFFKDKDTVEPINIPGEYIIADYNSISSVEEALSGLPPNSLAAILLEPMQGAGGSKPASIKFLHYLRDQATRLGALLIFDEVMTSRLYYAGGLSGKYGIKPDLITMGKYLGGGMSFGLFGGRRDVMSLFDPRGGSIIQPSTHAESNSTHTIPPRKLMLVHSGTFNNNIMTMSAGIAAAKILTSEVMDSVNSLGDYLRISVSKILADYNIISTHLNKGAEDPDINTVPRGSIWISGIGSINSIHFGCNDELSIVRDLFYFHMLESGIYLSRRGFIALTIWHTKADINQVLDAIKSFIVKWEHVLR